MSIRLELAKREGENCLRVAEHAMQRLEQCRKRFCPDQPRLFVGLSGSRPEYAAVLADRLLSEGHRLVLVPEDRQDDCKTRLGAWLNVQINLDEDQVDWIRSDDATREPLPAFDVAYFTSGSTSHPKIIGLSMEKLHLTSDWYRLIYGLDRDATILTCMPFSYNFTFVAAFCQARFNDTRLAFATPERIHSVALRHASMGRRTVLLANPIVIDRFLEPGQAPAPGLLVDSGGAPLSRHAIAVLRERVADIREGYGLSETCSLTHFDIVGNVQSLGSVGQPMPGVCTEIRLGHDGKPCIWIQSPNICDWIESGDLTSPCHKVPIATGDLGKIDEKGNLIVLGRAEDVAIGGKWPKETLNAIGPLLGLRCALVRHMEASPQLRIKVKGWMEEDLSRSIVSAAADFLGISPANVLLETHRGDLLHSLKLPRT